MKTGRMRRRIIRRRRKTKRRRRKMKRRRRERERMRERDGKIVRESSSAIIRVRN
jgi:hypothetical protein